MRHVIHAMAGLCAMTLIALFLSTSLIVEVIGDQAVVATAKRAIVFPGLFLLVPMLIIVGASGRFLARQREGTLLRRKMKRMRVVALMGIFVLIPCAITLFRWSSFGFFGTPFFVVQAIELAAGSANLVLISLNFSDGMKLRRYRRNATSGALSQ